MDYERVFDAAKIYAYSENVTILPEIHKSEKEIRKRLGLTGKSNPDLMTKSLGFIDVKSPFSISNISDCAKDASRQNAIVCITDDHCILDSGKIQSYANHVFKNPSYTKDEVHFVINGELYKLQRPKK